MDYQRVYNQLMSKSFGRMLDGYVERHHVVPKCMGGGDEEGNIATLTPEEHYVAHQLLVKVHQDNFKLLWAASCMTGTPKHMKRNNKLYGWLRRQLSERMSNRIVSEETRAKLRALPHRSGMEGKEHTEKTKQKMSRAAKGREFSPEHREALAKAKRGKKQGPHSEKHKKKLSKGIKAALAKKGRLAYFDDPTYRERQAQKMREVWAQRRQENKP